jgi:hypothetical protein
MKKEELLNLPLGTHELTDNQNNFHYTLSIDIIGCKRQYTIKEKGSIEDAHITLFEQYEVYNEFEDIRSLSVMTRIGGLCVHSTDYHKILNELKLII